MNISSIIFCLCTESGLNTYDLFDTPKNYTQLSHRFVTKKHTMTFSKPKRWPVRTRRQIFQTTYFVQLSNV